jgi:CRISPR system Cascade subunit CasE
MYLSKMQIVGTACRNPYEIHRALWELFPENTEDKRDFLFRVERTDSHRAEILMQSVRKPEKSSPNVQSIESRAYLLTLHEGQRLRFLLVANPIRTISDEKGRKSATGDPKKCRVPLIRDEDQKGWLVRKFDECASLETLIVDRKTPFYFRKDKEDRFGKIQPVIFQGVLNVREPETFVCLIRKGIGPAKAFGCGLLSLARG